MNHSRTRSGYSLLELMVVISVLATLMSVAAAWIHQSLTFSSVMRQRDRHHQSLMRLSRQLRDDIHHGQTALVDESNQLVISMSGDHQVTYTIDDQHGLLRQSREGDTVAHNRFSLAPTASAHWDASELPDWISLIVDRGPGVESQTSVGPPDAGPNERPAVDLYVRAGVGRHVGWDLPTAGETP